MKLPELSRVVLTRDLPDEKLSAGDVGTIVHAYTNGAAYEVEFFTLTGKTIAVATVAEGSLRPVAANDVASARSVAAE
ncbi:MAG TPA: DUF4926 domain-containing protein [Caulobacterales bacterium]|nr:DUF4926 domain-containing protein [Caulobacterales bacterium]